MKLELERTQRIGIDWLTLYNFDIQYEKNIKVVQEIGNECLIEKVKIDETLFSIDTVTRLYEHTNHITEYKSLRFNPNKILYGTNISNSQEEELLEAIEKLKKMLMKQGIKIDLSNAKIKEIEINCNFNRDFTELKEAFEVLFVKSPDLKKIANYEGGLSYKKMFIDRTIQGNWRSFLGIAYDKRKQINNENLLSEPLSRLEWRFSNGIINYYLQKHKAENSLNAIIENFTLIESIFREHTLNKLVNPAMEFISKKINEDLERKYLKFKEAAKFSRKNNLKEDRNVFKYLEENSWIFDKSFLIKIVKQYDKEHKKREIERINKLYSHHNNLEKLDYLVGIIFHH